MSVWKNDDGLTVLGGIDEAAPARVNEYTTSGPKRLVEVDILATELGGAAATKVLSEGISKIPLGVLIERAEFVVTEAFDSANDTADLHISLVDSDDETSNAQTFLVDAAVAELTSLGVITAPTGPMDGDAVGTFTVGDAPKVFKTLVDDEAFSAGRGVLRVWYSVPQLPVDNLGA